MRLAVFNAKGYDRLYLDHFADWQLTFFDAHLNEQSAPLAAGFDAVCCFVNDVVNVAVLEQLSERGVGLVAMRCAGFNNVDIAAARRLGIAVCRVPEYSPYAVAEHAAALVLDLNRHIRRAYARVREQDYSLDGLLGFDLHGKTAGIIGGGKIGQAFARIMNGFGCRTLVYDPAPSAAMAVLAEAVSIERLWAESDIVSLHCPLLEATHHLVNADTLAQMKPGVMLINTSRGGLIDTRAVIAALKSGRIGYLGLDVYEEEADLFFNDLSDGILQDDVFARLLTFPNVVITGHQAFFTREALAEIARVTRQNLQAYARGDCSGSGFIVGC
ncbi:2-hydroxyacid dehydrogenase [Gilvimarinus agarilyticus]|uniref:2-hydroxyacid dehydrogenase n=1 Tax=unclassified Gilvimarinus TaxID=2642066 RepID=UPI001C0977BC|nr:MULTISPECIES: 2-hydroxyacid dehydrogenase [unclassified Gilvimarinus]MBU2884344.1 2-hydroxyacid dehydrogenase [Gilvimarinus agarilyticus]MDO6569480.1 2-hydroxyacid dehydrogenase [Gilvimarinus sp. 2_MG-2023]MDO6748621.1 2-hydroxyacid dehydrogenase [Gilvimarinus sp. 1_MG-2023]